MRGQGTKCGHVVGEHGPIAAESHGCTTTDVLDARTADRGLRRVALLTLLTRTHTHKQSCALAFFSSPTTRLSVAGCFSACASIDPSEETGSGCLPGGGGGCCCCPGRLAVCWPGALCFSFSPSSVSAPFSEGLFFFAGRPLAPDEGAAAGWSPRASEEATSETVSTDVDFFLPGAFLGARARRRASSESRPSVANGPGGASGEWSGVDTLLRFSDSFLASLLFSFSFSRFFSQSLSFSLGAGSWGADEVFSFPPFPAPRPVSWALEGKRGNSGEGADDAVDDGAALARPMETVEKVLKGGVKALVASGLAEAPGKEPGLPQGAEPVSTDISEQPLPIGGAGAPGWLLRRVIEWDGDRGRPRTIPATGRLRRRELRWEPDGVWCGESEPAGLLPDDECSVTDSNIREWASLGRAPAPAPPPPGDGNAAGAAPPAPPAPCGSSPTSSAVRGGGRKLSKMGLRMRPSLAYLAEEKY
ncbi:hypothetical protein EYF80_014339 [Liparis tanakae]|uniref:Uncharacterized protein n=1 Tax=Liparis tanakae TaxID=230148 RepID=A0A4Z2IC20_9TELE|nr:hypothetical protein EYF80_014339 [Liparis tanakae]